MSVRSEVRERVEALGPGAFLRSAEIPGSRAAVDTAMSRIAAEAGLVRVSRGLYWRGVNSRYGAGRPDPLAVALAIAGPGAGPAGFSAARALGVTTQLPARPEVAVAGRVPEFAGAVFYKRNNLDRRGLDPVEVALLEVLRSWPTTSEVPWDELVVRVGEFVDRGDLDLDHTSGVAAAERNPARRDRFAALVDAVGRGA